MWTRQELKAKGKEAFLSNYWKNVLVAFILSLLTVGTSFASSRSSSDGDASVSIDPATAAVLAGGVVIVFGISVALDIFVWNPLQIGCYAFFKNNAENTAELEDLKLGFDDYVRKFLTMFLRGLYTFLWALLFIIPGIIKAYSYRMVPFIVQDEPELSPNEVITRSRQMMDGQKWNAFLLDLSFIGWGLLSLLTLGLVGIFWLNPYYQNTNAALYRRLSGQDSGDVTFSMDEPVVPVPPAPGE